MKLSKAEADRFREENGENLDLIGGSLCLSGTQITSLPEELTVGGWLNLSNTPIT